MSYSPVLGRWLEPDRAGYTDGMNRYEFVQDRPTVLTDPMGLEAGATQPSAQSTTQPGHRPPPPPTPLPPLLNPSSRFYGADLLCMSPADQEAYQRELDQFRRARQAWEDWMEQHGYNPFFPNGITIEPNPEASPPSSGPPKG